MESEALERWNTARSAQLDEIETVHIAIGGEGWRRHFATLQVNHAYAVLLTSQFQGFCRDIHSEAASAISRTVDPRLTDLVYLRLTQGRKLDRGNPNPGHLGSDFGWFQLDLWDKLRTLSSRNESRRQHLDDLRRWRNAIAHQDFSGVRDTALRLQLVKRWRNACWQLAQSIDKLLYSHLRDLTGSAPWP